jgi:hypothetical protein
VKRLAARLAAIGALHFGIRADELAAVWDYATGPLYTVGERAAHDIAVMATAVPNAVNRGRSPRHVR